MTDRHLFHGPTDLARGAGQAGEPSGAGREGILLIQSQVVAGRVGNTIAGFALQRLGMPVWQIPTVLLSNHPGMGPVRGSALAAGQVEGLARGVAETGELSGCAGILSGYLGQAENGAAALSAVRLARAMRPGAAYLCDPVLGDVGKGLYVPEPLAVFMRDVAVPQADIATPNLFELGWLTGMPVDDGPRVLDALRALRGRGPRLVVVTSVPAGDEGVDTILCDGAGFHRVRTPLLARPFSGSGDLFAALFLFWLLRTGSPAAALASAVSQTFAALRETERLGLSQIAIVEGQGAWVEASDTFRAEPAG